MYSKRKLRKAAAEAAAATKEATQSTLSEGINKAAEVLGDAQKRAAELLTEAQKAAGPMAHEARVRTADFASKHLDALEPHIKDALEKVSPAVESAREKVTDDLLPKLQGLLHDAAEHPVVAEVSRRGEATVQALAGELEPVRKKSKVRSLGKLLAVGAIVAGAVAAVRHFLTPKDDGWTAHEPSKAYVNNNDSFAAKAANVADVAKEKVSEAADVAAEKVAEATEAAKAKVDAIKDAVANEAKDGDNGVLAAENREMTSEGAPPLPEDFVFDAEKSEDAERLADYEGYGDGAYVGSNPPEGFTIKGNERSKKFHVEGGAGYERTIAEVWFNSEEAAEAAGFTKAQR